MTYTISFHSVFWKYTDNVKTCSVDADSYLNLVNNCMNLFPKLRDAIIKLSRQKGQEIWIALDDKLLELDRILMSPTRKRKITLLPVIFGRGDNIVPILIGIAIIAIAVFALQPEFALMAAAAMEPIVGGGIMAGGVFSATAAALFQPVLGLGISLLLTGVMGALFQPSASSPNTAASGDNGAFSSLQNTSKTLDPIPLNYGMIRVPGHFVSGFVKTVNHDRNSVVKVSDYLS